MRDTALASLLAAGVVVVLAPFAIHGVDWVHDGAMLKAAMDVRAGQVLFRDTLMVYGALTCYLQVFALIIFPSLLSIKLLTLGAYAVSLFFNYLAWRMILPRSLAITSCALFLLFIPTGEYGTFMAWSSVYAMMFQSVALYAIFQVIAGREAARWAFILGVSAACTFWCRQPVGILLTGALAVTWIALRATGWKAPGHGQAALLRALLGGFILVNAVMLAAIVVPGALPAWWHQNFVWPRAWASHGIGADAWRKYALPALRPAEAGWLLALFAAVILPRYQGQLWPRGDARVVYVYWAGLIALILWQHERVLRLLSFQSGGWIMLIPVVIMGHAALSAFAAVRGGRQTRSLEFHLVATLGVLSLSSLPQYFPIADPWHICWALSPVFGLFLFALWRWTAWPAPILAAMLAACLIPAGWHYAGEVRTSFTRPVIVLQKPAALQGMRVTPAQALVFEKISAAVDPVLALDPHIPAALFGREATVLCYTPNRENPSPYCFDVEGLTPESENQKRYRFIHDVRPLLFLNHPMRDAMKDYLQRTRYESQGYIEELDLEIFAPHEVMASVPAAAASR